MLLFPSHSNPDSYVVVPLRTSAAGCSVPNSDSPASLSDLVQSATCSLHPDFPNDLTTQIRCDAVGTPAVSWDDVLRTLDLNSRTKNRSEEVEFRRTKALASGGCRADRAVVLSQEEGALSPWV